MVKKMAQKIKIGKTGKKTIVVDFGEGATAEIVINGGVITATKCNKQGNYTSATLYTHSVWAYKCDTGKEATFVNINLDDTVSVQEKGQHREIYRGY